MIKQIRVVGADRLLKLWGQAPQLVEAKTRATLLQALLKLQAATQENTPTASSVLRNSIGHTVVALGPGKMLGAVGSPLDYAVPVELGTKPHFPPILAIQDWVESKLDPVDIWEAERISWGIARMIAKFGTKGRFMMRDALDDNETFINSLFDQAVKELIAELSDD